MRILLHKFKLPWESGFWEKIIKKNSPIPRRCKNLPAPFLSPLVAPPHPWDHNVNKLKSKLLLGYRIYWKIFLHIILYKNLTPIVAHPTHRDHDLNKFEFTLPEDGFIQVTAFLGNWLFKLNFFKEYFLFKSLWKNLNHPPIVLQPLPRGSRFWQTWMYTT